MSRKMIPVEVSLAKWRKDPKYRAAYDTLEGEFSLASALIEARTRADMTQAEVARAMGTTQGVVCPDGKRQGRSDYAHVAALCQGDAHAPSR